MTFLDLGLKWMATSQGASIMPRAIAINGLRLDEVPLLLESGGDLPTISYRCYSVSEFRVTENDQTLDLFLPTGVALELYRTGILPQDGNLPLELTVSGRVLGWFTISDLRYSQSLECSPVRLALTRVASGAATSDDHRQTNRSGAKKALTLRILLITLMRVANCYRFPDLLANWQVSLPW